MVPISSLWLPILLSAFLVFVVSSVLHMVLKYHRADYRPVPKEAEVLAALRAAGVTTPGLYNFPYCPSAQEMGSDDMVKKLEQGPVGILTVMPSGPMKLGKFLGLWFVYLLLVSLFAAYLAGRTMAPGTDYLAVFRVVGTATFMAYCLSPFVDSVWKGQPWSNTVRAMADGLLYALVTAGTFGWLWPR
jgi:hypothetical protein